MMLVLVTEVGFVISVMGLCLINQSSQMVIIEA